MTAGTLISGQSRGDGLDLAATGSWTAEHARTLEPQVDAATRADSRVRSVAIDVARIDQLDTFGAWLLERAMRTWTGQGCETRLIGLRDDYRGLFEKVHAGTHNLTPEPPKPNSIIASLESIGRTMAGVGADFVAAGADGRGADGRVQAGGVAPVDLPPHVDDQPSRARGMASGADHSADYRC